MFENNLNSHRVAIRDKDFHDLQRFSIYFVIFTSIFVDFAINFVQEAPSCPLDSLVFSHFRPFAEEFVNFSVNFVSHRNLISNGYNSCD